MTSATTDDVTGASKKRRLEATGSDSHPHPEGDNDSCHKDRGKFPHQSTTTTHQDRSASQDPGETKENDFAAVVSVENEESSHASPAKRRQTEETKYNAPAGRMCQHPRASSPTLDDNTSHCMDEDNGIRSCQPNTSCCADKNLSNLTPKQQDIAIDLTESPDLVELQKKVPQSLEEDDDVMIVDPPPPLTAPDTTTMNDDDDELQVVGGNTTNANIDFSHRRPDCGVHPFGAGMDQQYCDKCYCVVCDVPASDCLEWTDHCSKVPVKKVSPPTTDDVLLESPTTTARNYYASLRQEFGGVDVENIHPDAWGYRGGSPLDSDDEFGEYSDHRWRRNRQRVDEPREAQNPEYHYYSAKDMRIMDILGKKLRQALHFDEGGRFLLEQVPHARKDVPVSSEICSMDGDIPQLKLNTFFVEGVKIGWPFATVLPPQRQMAMHIVKALKRKMHVVIESPTGTGKSAAILCAVLAWQRYHMQSKASNEDNEQLGGEEGKSPPRIVYCSRTQSQVAQMVSSLKKTPYRPRMTVLGSRDRMCIHKDLTGKNKSNKVSISTECQIRRKNTELLRKKAVKQFCYSDNDPTEMAGDGAEQDDAQEEVTDNALAGNDENADANAGDEGTQSRRNPPPTCPHFRQLTSDRTARLVAERFTGDPQKANCCSVGGEESSYGVHDMEDLAAFGKNPYLLETVAIYRGKNGKFGFSVGINSSGKGCYVHAVTGAAKDESLLKTSDHILSINGADARNVSSVDHVLSEIHKTPLDKPLRLKVLRKDGDTDELLQVQTATDHGDKEVYSRHSVCPYYLSRAIHPFTELTFAPYNYILDPGIRNAMNISLANTVVVLDEAHNVESTLCEGGSGKFGEIDLCQILCSLARHSRRTSDIKDMEMIGTREKVNSAKVAHHLLLFVDKIVLYLRSMRQKFDNSATKSNMKVEYQKYHNISDDHEEELSYSGPTGWGLKGTPVGCQPFLTELGLTSDQMDDLLLEALSLEESISGGSGDTDNTAYAMSINTGKDPSNANNLTLLVELISKVTLAIKHSEHFYISCVAQANGNLDHAFGIESLGRNGGAWKKKPKKLPLIFPRSPSSPQGIPPDCTHQECQHQRHGEYCDESTPSFECHLIVKLLSPGLLLKDISSQCRSLVLASGSLAPLPSLCAELNLYGKESASMSGVNSPQSPTTGLCSQSSSQEKPFVGRLQTQPKPLEANHVIDLQKQLLAVSVGHFPDGERLTVTYNNYKESTFFPKLGAAIASVIECIPTGGVLVFLPSYSFLRRCYESWSENYEIWHRLIASKGKIIVEPTKSQEEFVAARNEYQRTIETTGKCILLAVFRGKMSEGISFNDDYARGVICVGIPFPNARDRAVTAKKAYNDEQRKLRKNTNLLPGMEWYQQQAQRAIAQALGRCIRHQADYGTIILMDSRHCDDGSPNDGICRAHQNMPKWMRHSIRTLSMRRDVGVGNNPIVGGYQGLRQEMVSFFVHCPKVSQAVRAKWKSDLDKAKERQKQSPGHVFDKQTGTWSSSTPEKDVGVVKKEKIKSERLDRSSI